MKLSKRILSLLLIIILFIGSIPLSGLSAFADNLTTGSCGENVSYSFDSSTGTLTISGSGPMADYSSRSLPPYYSLNITSAIIENGVTYLGNYSFYKLSKLTSIDVASTVAGIGGWAFYNSKLNKVNIHSIEKWCTINISTGSSANPLTIGRYLYLDDVLVEDLTIPNTVTSISNEAFYNCKSITSLNLPNGLISLGSRAFEGCTGLTSVHLPDSLEVIGSSAFRECKGLTSVFIPKNVVTVYNNSFSECPNLTSVVVDSANIRFDSRNNCNAIIETENNNLVFGCGISSIPNTVTSIGDWAFVDCSELTSLVIPNSVTSIGEYAFVSCDHLSSITIPDSVVEIKTAAFQFCDSLTSITLPKNMEKVSEKLFYYCSYLQTVILPTNLKEIETNAFYSCSKLSEINLPATTTKIHDKAFIGCRALAKIVVGNKDCVIDDTNNTIPSTTAIYGHNNSSAKQFAEDTNRTFVSICDGYRETTETKPPQGYYEKGYNKKTCSVCGDNYYEEIYPIVSHGDATRFANHEYILPVAKSCVYNNTLYARFDKPYAQIGSQFYSSSFRFAELLDNNTLQLYKTLTSGAPRAWYVLGAVRNGSNWINEYSGGIIDSALLPWAAGEPNNDGGSENRIAVDRNGYLNDSSATYNTTAMGFIVGTNLDNLKPARENKYLTNKYTYYNVSYPFSYAQAFCEAKGGHLATVHSADENASIKSTITSGQYAFLGGYRNSSNTFEWISGEKLSYTNWNPGEPNNASYGSGQYYMQIYPDGKWDDCNDLDGSKNAEVEGFVCEYEPLKIYAKLSQDNVHGITDDEIKIFAEYPDQTTADITSSCDIDYHYNKGNVVVHATATKPNGEEIETTNSLAVNKGNHRFEEGETIQATCTQAGQSTVVCTICGKVIATAIPAKGHQLTKDIVEPTCEKSGYQREFCNVCDYDELKILAPLGHQCNAPEIVLPTATTRGYTSSICKVCGDEFKSDFVMPKASQIDLSIVNQQHLFQLSSEDEFAALHFRGDINGEFYVLKQSKNCVSASAKVYDDAGNLISTNTQSAFKQYFEANRDYLIVADYAPTRSENAIITLAVLENETEIKQENLSFKINLDNNSLRISGFGNIADLSAIDMYRDFIECIVIDADIEGISSSEVARFINLNTIQFKGADTDILGNATNLANVTINAYSGSKAHVFAEQYGLQFSALSGYTYTFDANGGTINGKSTYIISNKSLNNRTLADFVPTYNNHKFIGWVLEHNPETVLSALPEEQNNLVLKAIWNSDSNNVFADDVAATAGDQITIPIRIENNAGIMGCKIDVTYNKDNLTPVKVAAGEVFNDGLEDNITGDAKPGSLCVYWAGNQNVDADGVLFNLTFNVKKSAKGDDTIGLSYSQEDTFEENFNDVVLDCREISLTYTNTIEEDVPTVEIGLHENAPINVGDIFAADITVKNVNSDLTDNLYIEYDHEKFELVEFASANNNTTLEDDVLKINSLPGGTTAVGTLVFKAISKESAGENQIVLTDGKNAIGCQLVFDVSAPAASNEITVSGSITDLDKDGSFKVNVNFAGNSGIMGYKLRFTYDSSLIKPVSASKSEKFKSGELTTNIGKKDGEFVVAWHNTQNVFGDGDAFVVQFKRITEEPVNTTIVTTYSVADTFNESWEDITLNTQDIPLTINDSTTLFNVYGGDEDSCVSAKAGESVTVPVYIKDNPGLMGTKLTFDYNADYLTPVSVTAGDIFSGGLQDNIDGDAVPGSFNVYWAGSQNVYDNGILFFITFSVSENATGQEEIAISYSQEDTFDENFDDVILKCQNILVKYQSIPQYTPMFNLSLADNVPVYAGDNFVVNIAIANAPESINDSFNLDFDSTRFAISEFIAQNGINATLVNKVLSINATGLSENAAIGTLVVKAKGVYGSENNEIAIGGSETVLGNKVVLDVLQSLSASGITLSSEVFDLATDGSFKIRINCNDNAGIMGYKLRFTYNPSIIQPISATKGSLFSTGTLTNNIGNKTGEFVVVWQSTQDVVGDGEMLVLCFKALSTVNISTDLGVSYSAGDTFNEEWQPVVINCEEIPIVLDFSLAKINLTCDFSEFDVPINGGNVKVFDETHSVAANEAFDEDNFSVQLDKGKSYSVIITLPKRVSIKIDNISSDTSVDLNEVFDKSKQNGGFDVRIWPLGDVDASDVIDIGDISSLLKTTNYGFRVQNAENKYCDLNDDSVIDIADISLILATANYGKSGVVIDYAIL